MPIDDMRDLMKKMQSDSRVSTAKDGLIPTPISQKNKSPFDNSDGTYPNLPPDTFEIPNTADILKRLDRIERTLHQLLRKEEEVTESRMKPPEVEDVPDSVPEEWLEDLETEEPPSPERLRKLAGMMARNADFDGEVEVPAREFVRVLLMLADMKQQEAMSAVNWNQLEPEGPHRDVGIMVDKGAAVCRVTIDVPLHIMSYGGSTTARHVRQRFSSAMGALRKITKMETREDVGLANVVSS